MPLGEASGEITPRVERLAALLSAAGIPSAPVPDIRRTFWTKLLGNMAFNPLSAITLQTLGEIVTEPHSAALARSIMEEVIRLCSEGLGMELGTTAQERIGGLRSGATLSHKTSMLQDWESGKRLELEHICGAALEISERVGVPMPVSSNLYALLQARAGHLASL